MKKLLFLISILSSLAIANYTTSRYEKAVMDSSDYWAILCDNNQILGIQQTDKFIDCPGCFEFEVHYINLNNKEKNIAKFYTRDSLIAPDRPILVWRRDKDISGPHS